MSSSHLAAIMFTDIVGYTAMMQRNQAEAMAAIKTFESILRDRIATHEGELVQTYGDGSLSVFDSASAAVLCAKEIQEQLRGVVPLRIGIHVGEITRDGEHTFGDGVNIASRIESMGIAGSVLFSKEVWDKIRNRPEIKTQSLGSFHFKNSSEPVSVFALEMEGFAVPNSRQIAKSIKGKKQSSTLQKVLIPVMIAAILAFAGYWFNSEDAGPESFTSTLQPSIAVMPFRDLSQTQDQSYFCDGVAEEILNQLASLNELKVAGRTSSFSFRDRNATVSEIGEALKVSHILDGSVKRAGNQVRISTQLIDASNGYQLWALSFDRELTDIFKVQDEITDSVIEALSISIIKDQSLGRSTEPVNNSLAYDAYLKGVYAYNSGDLLSARDWFEKAIKLNPEYASAYALLATSLHYLNFLGHRRASEEIRKIKTLAQKAWELDSTSREVLSVRIFIEHDFEFDYQTARKLIARGLSEFPSWYLMHQHAAYGVFFRGEPAEKVLSYSDKTIELDPLSGNNYAEVSYLYAYYRQWDRLKQLIQDVKKDIPRDFWGKYAIANAHFYLGQYEKAYDGFKPLISDLAESRLTFYMVNYLQVLSKLNKTEELQEWAERLTTDEILSASSTIFAQVYYCLGNKEKTYEFLTKALKDDLTTLRFIKMDPFWDDIREEAEFQEIISKI